MRSPVPTLAPVSFRRDQWYRDFGAKLRLLRENRGLTQGGLATSVGLTRTSLTNIEKGRQKVLLHTVMEIAAALSVDARELLPSTVKAFDASKMNLPASLSPSERDFLQRALNPALPYEAKTST